LFWALELAHEPIDSWGIKGQGKERKTGQKTGCGKKTDSAKARD
jgi:hypothetical protein